MFDYLFDQSINKLKRMILSLTYSLSPNLKLIRNLNALFIKYFIIIILITQLNLNITFYILQLINIKHIFIYDMKLQQKYEKLIQTIYLSLFNFTYFIILFQYLRTLII